MDRVNGRIVTSVLIIMAAGVYRVVVVQPSGGQSRQVTVTRVIVAAYLLGIVASIIDLVGGPVSAVSGLLLLLAVLTAAYAVLPDVFQRITARNK